MMTPARFRQCRNVIGWTGRGLAAQLAIDERHVRRMAAGLAPIDADIARWLETLARVHEANPPPRRRDTAA